MHTNVGGAVPPPDIVSFQKLGFVNVVALLTTPGPTSNSGGLASSIAANVVGKLLVLA